MFEVPLSFLVSASSEELTCPRNKLEQGRGGPPPRRPPPRDAAGILRDLDFNNDGKLTLNGIPPYHRPHLMRADTDGDEILTREELEAFLKLALPPPPPR